MKIIIVGFKVSEENSVFYRKVTVPTETLELALAPGKLNSALRSAIEKSDFISIRINRNT